MQVDEIKLKLTELITIFGGTHLIPQVSPPGPTLHTGTLRPNLQSDPNGPKTLSIDHLKSYRMVCRLIQFD